MLQKLTCCVADYQGTKAVALNMRRPRGRVFFAGAHDDTSLEIRQNLEQIEVLADWVCKALGTTGYSFYYGFVLRDLQTRK